MTTGHTDHGIGAEGFTAHHPEAFDAQIAEPGTETALIDSGPNPARQRIQVQNLFAQRVHVMIIWPVNGQAIVPFVKQAHEAGIPVIATNSNIDPSGKEFLTAFTGPDDWSQEKAQTLMENYITRFGDQIDGVYAAESGMGMGAYAAIQAAVADGRIQDGHIRQTDATIYQSVYGAIEAGT